MPPRTSGLVATTVGADGEADPEEFSGSANEPLYSGLYLMAPSRMARSWTS